MVHALILSGGNGIRLGSNIPKQYLEVGNRMIISYCLETFFKHNGVDKVWIVAAHEWHESIKKFVSEYDKSNKFAGFTVPGENRQLSIYYGLSTILGLPEANEVIGADIAAKYGEDTVIIHDAARPMVSSQTITYCINACREHDGAMPALPMKDTVYYSDNGTAVTALIDRSKVYAGQAPESYRLVNYYLANKRLFPEAIRRINGSTEPAIIAGMDVLMIPGDEGNFKITTKADFEKISEIVRDLY